MPYLFKIKCKTSSNILLDLSNGGFLSQSITINNLPVGNNNVFLEVNDNQGRSVLIPCFVNVKFNDNQPSMENFLANVNDISQKMVMMEIYTSSANKNKENQVDEKLEINIRLDILNSFFEDISVNFDSDKFLYNFDKVISFLLGLSNKNLKDINFKNLYDLLDIIVNNIDPFLDDMNKISLLYKILNNFSENIKNKNAQILGIYFDN